MSTSYYRLREPFTSLRLEEGPGYEHDRLTVWEAGANAGTLTLSKGWGRRVASLFADEHSDPPLHSHWGGKDRGAVVAVNDPSLPDDATVVSEYGDVLTVAQVKARDGARRTDGMPTELFGYEP